MTTAITPADAEDVHHAIPSLTSVLLDCVAGGASIGFLASTPASEVEAYWSRIAEGVAAGSHRLLLARDAESDDIVGTVHLGLAGMPNSRHRAEVSKLLVATRARRRGVGTALMHAVEAEALRLGRWLLVLDTMEGSDSDRLYRTLGWTALGSIPDYALFPDGSIGPTTVFYRRLR